MDRPQPGAGPGVGDPWVEAVSSRHTDWLYIEAV